MRTFNPIYFGHNNPDFIPANPPVAQQTADPNRRDNALHPEMNEAQWHLMKTRWSLSHSTGELESPFMMQRVEPKEINRILAAAWENHGKEKVTTIVLWLSPICVDEQLPQLKHYGFERAEYREKKIPQLCFTGPAARWKD